MYMNVKP